MFTHGQIGLFGKLPAQGDFLRVHVADPTAQGLVRWFEEGVEGLHRANARLAGDPVRFVFRLPGASSFLVGVFATSVDRVGRNFPLAIFVPVQARDAGAQFPLVPAVYAPFFQAATAVLAEAPRLEGKQLAEKLPHLPLPGEAELRRAETFLRRAAGSDRAVPFSTRHFGDPAVGLHYYAYWTFLSACQPVRGKEPSKANVALDCPASDEVDLHVWLDLSRRLLRWSAPPPFFWRDQNDGRLLLSVGPASGALLTYLSDPTRPTNKVWPLRTEQSNAAGSAKQGLGPAQVAAIDRPDGSIDQLIELLSH
jgi:type VI secretion system protein ImpM